MSNVNQIMRQAQAMQRKLLKAQEELATKEVEASAGGGMVTAVVTGGIELKEIRINPEAVDPEDVEMLADIITAAVNEALRNARQLEQDTLGGITTGLGLPPGLV